MFRCVGLLFLGLLLALAGCGGSTKPDTTPPAAIADLMLASVGDSSVTLRWTAPGDDGNKGQATAYDLRYGQFSVLTYWEMAQPAPAPVPSLAGTTDSVVVGGLAKGTSYNFAIRAIDEAGNESELSNMVSGVPQDLVAPSPITDLAATVLDHRRVALRWTAPGDDGDQGLVEGYDIRYAVGSLEEASWQTYPRASFTQIPVFGGQEQVDTVLVPDPSTTYNLAVRAYDESGNMAGISNVVAATTPADTIPPAAVEDLAVRLEPATSVVLSWTAPGDDGSEGQAATYEVRYSQSPLTEASWTGATPVDGPSPGVSGTPQELVVNGLTGGTTYYFALRTTDEAGNTSGLSNVAQQETGQPRVWQILPDGSGDAPTIQAGIDSARMGDSVELLDGTFTGDGNRDLDFKGKAITVQSQSGDPALSIIDCGGSAVESHRGFTFQSGEGSDAVVRALTITAGYAHQGGALACLGGSSPSIDACTLSGNTASAGGGGAYFNSSTPSFTGCRFIDNASLSSFVPDQTGGAIQGYGSGVEISDCYFENNSAAWGGALSFANGTIRRCVFKGNIANRNPGDGFGGAIFAGNLTQIEDCIFVGNEADYGGAIAVLEAFAGGLHMDRCTLYGNIAPVASGVFNGHSGAYLTNCILAYGQGGPAVDCQLGGTRLTCSDVFGNEGGDWVGCFPDDKDKPGNISLDPLFCDPENGVFTLQADSPCGPDSSSCGLIGALPPNCGAVPLRTATWGRIGAKHR